LFFGENGKVLIVQLSIGAGIRCIHFVPENYKKYKLFALLLLQQNIISKCT
jgi:hypothetical protein